jgi:hypothetical protein
MATPRPVSYRVASGATVYGGRMSPTLTVNPVGAGSSQAGLSGVGAIVIPGPVNLVGANSTQSAYSGTASIGLPSWVPTPGTFANIGSSTLNSAKPAGWPATDSGGPFELWSSAAYASDFSDFGAFVVHGSGHQDAGSTLFGGVWVYDLDDLTWKGRNVPSPGLLEPQKDQAGNVIDGSYNNKGESLLPGNTGHTYVPHSYDGLVYQNAAMGGGPKGSLIRVAGGGWNTVVHRFDLSSPTNPPTRIVDDIQVWNGYAQSAIDTTRNCIWSLSGKGIGPLNRTSLPGYTVAGFGADYDSYGDNSMVYMPPPYDCLVSMGKSGDGNIGTYLGVRVSKIVNDIPQPWVFISGVSGSPGTYTPPGAPSDPRCGGVWSTILNCIVCYEGGLSAKVHKLIPPAPANVTTDTWQWQSETLSGVGGAVPSYNNHANNGSWSKFIEVPKARCFIWCDSMLQVPQAWRLMGM